VVWAEGKSTGNFTDCRVSPRRVGTGYRLCQDGNEVPAWFQAGGLFIWLSYKDSSPCRSSSRRSSVSTLTTVSYMNLSLLRNVQTAHGAYLLRFFPGGKDSAPCRSSSRRSSVSTLTTMSCEFVSSPKRPDRPWGLLSLLFNACWGFFPEAKRPAWKADHRPPPSAEVKNTWSYTSAPPVYFHGVRWDNVAFTLNIKSTNLWNCPLSSLPTKWGGARK